MGYKVKKYKCAGCKASGEISVKDIKFKCPFCNGVGSIKLHIQV